MTTPEPKVFGTYYRKRDGAQIWVGDIDRTQGGYRWVTYKLANGRTYRVSLFAFWQKFQETPGGAV